MEHWDLLVELVKVFETRLVDLIYFRIRLELRQESTVRSNFYFLTESSRIVSLFHVPEASSRFIIYLNDETWKGFDARGCFSWLHY